MCDRPLPASKTKPRRFCPDAPGVACRQGFQRLKAEQGTLVICRNRAGTFRVRPGELNASLIFTPTTGAPEQFVRGYEIEFPRAPLADRKERLPQTAILDKFGNGTMGGVNGRLRYYTKQTKSGYRVRFRDWSQVIAAREACHLARARRFEFNKKGK